MNSQNAQKKSNALLSALYDFAELFVVAICVVIILFPQFPFPILYLIVCESSKCESGDNIEHHVIKLKGE